MGAVGTQASNGALHGDRRLGGVNRAHERDHQAIAEVLDLLAAMGGDRRAEGAKVGAPHLIGGVVTESGAQLRRPDQVGEQDRDRAGDGRVIYPRRRVEAARFAAPGAR